MKKIREKIEKIYSKSAGNLDYCYGIDALEKIIKKNPEFKSDENTLCQLGMLYDHLALKYKGVKRKKYEDKAINLYNIALKINPKSESATWGIGRVWWHRKSKRAIPYAKKAYRLRKNSGKSMGLFAQGIGLVYGSLGDYKKEEYWLLKGLEESPNEFGSYLNLVNFYVKLEKPAKTKKYLEKLEKLYKKEPLSFRKTKWGQIIKKEIIDKNK